MPKWSWRKLQVQTATCPVLLTRMGTKIKQKQLEIRVFMPKDLKLGILDFLFDVIVTFNGAIKNIIMLRLLFYTK